MTRDELSKLPVGRAATVDVPASSANLGPGFDAVGLALNWRDSYRVEVISSGVQVAAAGAGGDPVPDDDSNLVLRSLRQGLNEFGYQAPGLRLTGQHTIPHGRGLGSSAAAIVAGLAAAEVLAVPSGSVSDAGTNDPAGWLPLADRIEGHPDNVAAALAGGLVLIARHADGGLQLVRQQVHPEVGALALVPDQPMSTDQARGLLPPTVPHGAAVANSARAALLVHALTTDPGLLYEATQDQLHQHYRAPAMPASAALLESLRANGIPAVLSGSGPTVLIVARSVELDRAAAMQATGFRAVWLGVGAGVCAMSGAETAAFRSPAAGGSAKS